MESQQSDNENLDSPDSEFTANNVVVATENIVDYNNNFSPEYEDVDQNVSYI